MSGRRESCHATKTSISRLSVGIRATARCKDSWLKMIQNTYDGTRNTKWIELYCVSCIHETSRGWIAERAIPPLISDGFLMPSPCRRTLWHPGIPTTKWGESSKETVTYWLIKSISTVLRSNSSKKGSAENPSFAGCIPASSYIPQFRTVLNRRIDRIHTMTVFPLY